MYAPRQEIGKSNNLKVFGSMLTKGHKQIVKIGYGQLYLRQFAFIEFKKKYII